MLDIRIPIGLMFTIVGVIIGIYGIVTISDTAMYAKSLSININLWLGILMVVFGGTMLFFAKKKGVKKEQ